MNNDLETLSTLELLRADWAHLQELNGTERRLRLWNFLSPRFAHIVLIRASLGARRRGLAIIAKIFAFLLYFGFRVELNTHATIGPGLVLPHPMGIVIGAHRIGKSALIYQNTTLGAKTPNIAYDPGVRPHLEDNVTVGSGAVIVGGVTVGDGCVIAANSLVTHDVEPMTIAMGVPAQFKKLVQQKPDDPAQITQAHD